MDSKIIFEREVVDRFYFRNKGVLPYVESIEVCVKLNVSLLRQSSLFEVMRYIGLLELIAGQSVLVVLLRGKRRSWVELKVTIRGSRYSFLFFLFNRIVRAGKELSSGFSVGSSSVNGLRLFVHNTKFFYFLGRHNVVNEKILSHFCINILLRKVCKSDKVVPSYFAFVNCIRGY